MESAIFFHILSITKTFYVSNSLIQTSQWKLDKQLKNIYMITLYDMGIIQNKAQKAWEKFEETKMKEVLV